MRKAEILAITGTCPYLLNEKGSTTIACECAAFRFPDKTARREIIYGFCAHPSAYKNCVFKAVMDRYYYERKYSNEFFEEDHELFDGVKKSPDKIGERKNKRLRGNK